MTVVKGFVICIMILILAGYIPTNSGNYPGSERHAVCRSGSFHGSYSISPAGSDPYLMGNKNIRQEINASNLIPEKNHYRFNLLILTRGVFGMIVLIIIAWIFSENRKAINWKLIGTGLCLQILLAVGILHIPLIQGFFGLLGKLFIKVLDFTSEGTRFLFRSYSSGVIEAPLQTFAINILPTIIFFAALTSVLFYFGIIQKVVWLMAWIMTRLLNLSGAESLAVAGNIFLGQLESPLMIKAYLEKMNRSEILMIMSAGMATMAGGVLAVYINFLGGDDPVQRLLFAKHLLAASVMAAPGSVVISKILVPQTEAIDMNVKVPEEKIGKNVLDAINKGSFEGLRLAVSVGAMLLVFIAFLAMINFLFNKIGDWAGLNNWISDISDGRYVRLSLQFILGYSLSPLMWVIGINIHDISLVGSLLGEKLIMTEFMGYISLSSLKESGAFSDPKSIIIATYILCGFANFASMGIQIGGIGALAPGQRVLLAKFGLRAVLAGTLASLLSATIIGVILS
jgi:CNT family concentrative nucleoside transporter